MGQQWRDIERAEEHFGMQIPDVETLQRLNHQEQTFGREAHEWIAEGMPVDIMGKTRDMNAFRERQAERPPEVPKNIERQNRRSVLRSERAATETGPAGDAGVPEPVRDVLSTRGQSLDGSIQRVMEDRMGDSFGDVRIHTGSIAAAACEAINARAFTVGSHIAFNQGEYDPESARGQHVLAHELAHVRQQTGGAVSMLPQAGMELEIDPDPALEREAEDTAQRVMEGGELGIQCLRETAVHVQRLPDRVGMAEEWSIGKMKTVFGETEDGDLDLDTTEVVKEGTVWGFLAHLMTNPETATAAAGAATVKELVDQASKEQIRQLLDELDSETWIYRQVVRTLVNSGLEKLFGEEESDTGEGTPKYKSEDK